MTKAWLGGAITLAVACGPTVPTDDTGGNDESGDPDSTSEGSTSSEVGTTRDPASSSSSPIPPPDLPQPDVVDGPYLLAVAITVDPAHPLQYIADTRIANGLLDLILVPLTLEIGSTTSPRLPSGEPLVFQDIPLDGGDCFVLDMGEVFIAGETNPITGADMVADIVLSGCFAGLDYCGTVDGQVNMPIQLALTGSTFAAIEASPQMLPIEFPSAC